MLKADRPHPAPLSAACQQCALERASVSSDNNCNRRATREKQTADPQVLADCVACCRHLKWLLLNDLDGNAKDENYRWVV